MTNILTTLESLLGNVLVIESIIFIGFVYVARLIAIHLLRRKREVLDEGRRRWITVAQNLSAVIMVLGLIIIWTSQITSFALSIAAFAVAIVVGLKELIQSILGAIHRATSRPFEVGDWIEFAGHRGEVTDEGPLSFRMLELGRGARAFTYTGRVLVFPNARLLMEPVFNESFRKRFVYHNFAVTVDPGPDAQAVRDFMRRRIDEALESQKTLAARYHGMARRKTHTDLPPIDPVVHVHTTDFSKLVFTVTMFCATAEAARIEADVVEATLGFIRAAQLKDKEAAEKAA